MWLLKGNCSQKQTDVHIAGGRNYVCTVFSTLIIDVTVKKLNVAAEFISDSHLYVT